MDLMPRLSGLVLSAAVLTFPIGNVVAEIYPKKPIRFIVPYPAGGSVDILARIIGQKLTERLREQVVIDNRPGGGGNLGMEIAAYVVPDGYSMVMVTSSQAINVSLYKKLRYDPVKDFSPVSLVGSTPQILLVYPSFPPQSVKELIALAQSKPSQLNYASAGNGSVSHLTMELFRSMAGIDLVHIPYKGGPQAITDVTSGRLSMLFTSMPAALPHVKAGRLRALGVTSSTPSQSLPDTPTIAETIPSYEVVMWYGIVVPAGTPTAIVAKLNSEIGNVLTISEVKERLAVVGVVEPTPNTPKQFADYLKAEILKWAKVVKSSGARID